MRVVRRAVSACVAAGGLCLLVLLLAQPAPAGAGSAARSVSAPVAPQVLAAAEAGETTFWVELSADADLAAATQPWESRAAQGRAVYRELRAVAERSQAPLIERLRARGARFRAFWISNTIQVTGGVQLVHELAAQPGVEAISAPERVELPEPVHADPQLTLDSVEWNIAQIRADEAWDAFGTRGEGVVVANIDSGVDGAHPALADAYRGRAADGTLSHDYNWFDANAECGAPCDPNRHGTHTMGTIAGRGGIGVAPAAKWVAAKACSASGNCTTAGLLAAAQWVLAPTDAEGLNPRPDLRPDIVNNSWGAAGLVDPWFVDVHEAWEAAGIFAVFSNGNTGPGCQTSGSPGQDAEAFSVGAYDRSGTIASFSSRGRATDDRIKPDIAAPGAGVRSSVPGGDYQSLNGTSMAAPHVAGVVGLMWAASAAVRGDVEGTRSILAATAVDAPDLQCGGAPERNNVYGEGRLDAYAALSRVPRGAVGRLSGTLTAEADGTPLADARVTARGAYTRSARTAADGSFSMVLPTGTYEVTAGAYGFVGRTVADVAVATEETTTRDFALGLAPTHPVAGQVTGADGRPVEDGKVALLDVPVEPVRTDAEGRFRFDAVPEGEYELRVSGRCQQTTRRELLVDGGETLQLQLAPETDRFGYGCGTVRGGYVEATHALGFVDGLRRVTLPFDFPLYGRHHRTAYITAYGYATFDDTQVRAAYANGGIPGNRSPSDPNAAVYAFWDGLVFDERSGVYTGVIGEAPRRGFVIEWRNVRVGSSTSRFDAEAILYEDGDVSMRYRGVDHPAEAGASATVGIENGSGDDGLQYSLDEPSVRDGTAVDFAAPPRGWVSGTVTDVNDGAPVAGATVTATRDGVQTARERTGRDGRYRLWLPLGDHDLEVSARHYVDAAREATVARDGGTVTVDAALETARGQVSAAGLHVVAPAGEIRTRRLTVSNTGSAPLHWSLRESGGERVDASARAQVAPGEVLRSWAPVGMRGAYGIADAGGRVWLSDTEGRPSEAGPPLHSIDEFTSEGTRTGRVRERPAPRQWHVLDLAYDTRHGDVCGILDQPARIECFDPETGADTATIGGSFRWNASLQFGLAYREDDDSFYLGGLNDRVIYHVAGRSHPAPGSVLGSCRPPNGVVTGLAYNDEAGVLWMDAIGVGAKLYQLDPRTCETLGTLGRPVPDGDPAGLDLDPRGNLWMVGWSPNDVMLVDSGLPALRDRDVPWLSTAASSGEALAPGRSADVDVRVDTTGLEPGVYEASLVLVSDSGRQPHVEVPLRVVVPRYQAALNAGGPRYTDKAGDVWRADRAFAAGGFGYVGGSKERATTHAIAGTDDDPLYQFTREGMRSYRFAGLPSGRYVVELEFAEIAGRTRPRDRRFDVVLDGTAVLYEHDIAREVGPFAADRHEQVVTVDDGDLSVEFNRRDGAPVISGIRVTERPDR